MTTYAAGLRFSEAVKFIDGLHKSVANSQLSFPDGPDGLRSLIATLNACVCVRRCAILS